MLSKLASFLLLAIAYSYAQDCEDEVGFCGTLEDRNLCTLNVAQRRCRKTCNNCTAPVPQRLIPGPGCMDTNPACEDSFHVCAVDSTGREQCLQTCELCECYDKVNFCLEVVNEKQCDRDAAKRNCRHSCKHCGDAIPEIQAPTDTCKDERPDCEEIFYVCWSYPDFASQCQKTCNSCGNQTVVATTLTPEITTGYITETPGTAATEVVTENPEVTPEATPETLEKVTTEAPEVTPEVVTENPEVTPEATLEIVEKVTTEAPEVTPEVVTENPEVTPEATPEILEKVTTEAPEVTPEAVAEGPEGSIGSR